jgi:hypothetical protein
MSHLGGYFCCPLQGYVPHGRILLLPNTGLCPTWADTFVAHYRVMSHMGRYFCCPLQGYVPHGLILLLPITGSCSTWADTFVVHYRVMSKAKTFCPRQTFLGPTTGLSTTWADTFMGGVGALKCRS